MRSFFRTLGRSRHTLLIDPPPARPGPFTGPATRATALLVALGLCFPARAAAQNCSPSYKEVAQAMYSQIAELGVVGGGVDQWAEYLQGGTTVKQMVYENVHWQGYRDRFITGHDGRTVVTYLYRHLLAREPDDGAWGWVAVGQQDGWHVVINAILNSDEYNTRFGDHVLPGSPIVAWDCQRATGVFEAHQNSVRDGTQGAATVSYSTPAYISLDQPRSLTFLYSSGLVSPNGLVQVNVVDNTGTPPDRASIRLLVNGAWVTDEVFYSVGPGATRLAASFDARDYPSMAVPVTAVVRKYWPGRTEEFSIATRAVVVSERYSQTGMGWVLAGMQALTDQGDGVLITESGTGAWFWKQGTDGTGDRRYASPAGDFTRVRWDAATQAYWRDYPDGTRVRFRADGRMVDATDRYGNATQYGYGGSG
jgi:hypothetical protein